MGIGILMIPDNRPRLKLAQRFPSFPTATVILKLLSRRGTSFSSDAHVMLYSPAKVLIALRRGALLYLADRLSLFALSFSLRLLLRLRLGLGLGLWFRNLLDSSKETDLPRLC